MFHTVKCFGIVNKAEIDIFLELSCFFNDPMDVGNLISVSAAFSKTSLNIWKFTVHVLLKRGLENFEHYFASVDFPCGSHSKASVYNAGDLGLIPGLGRFPGEGNGNPLQYPCLESPMDGGAWCPWGRKESDTTE